MESEGLSPLEKELLEIIKCGALTLKEIREMNPRYVGALARLKSRKLIEIIRLPGIRLIRYCGKEPWL